MSDIARYYWRQQLPSLVIIFFFFFGDHITIKMGLALWLNGKVISNIPWQQWHRWTRHQRKTPHIKGWLFCTECRQSEYYQYRFPDQCYNYSERRFISRVFSDTHANLCFSYIAPNDMQCLYRYVKENEAFTRNTVTPWQSGWKQLMNVKIIMEKQVLFNNSSWQKR